MELRDGGKRYNGKGVLNAVRNVNEAIATRLKGQDCRDQVRRLFCAASVQLLTAFYLCIMNRPR